MFFRKNVFWELNNELNWKNIYLFQYQYIYIYIYFIDPEEEKYFLR